jgi:hypothetical protein
MPAYASMDTNLGIDAILKLYLDSYVVFKPNQKYPYINAQASMGIHCATHGA